MEFFFLRGRSQAEGGKGSGGEQARDEEEALKGRGARGGSSAERRLATEREQELGRRGE